MKGLALLPHQEREVAILRDHPRALLLSATGTGKTVTLLTRAREALAQGGRVLWLTNSSLQAQLVAEAGKWLPPSLQPCQLLEAAWHEPFTYATHELAMKRVDHLQDRGPYSLLVVDEAAKVGGGGVDRTAKKYRAIRALSHAADSAILATAEPLASVHALDLWAIADVAGIPGLPDRETMNKWVQWQELRQSHRTKRVAVGISGPGFAALLAAIRPFQVRTRLADVATLPDVETSHYPVRLSAEAASEYAAASQQPGLSGHHGRQAASRDALALVPEAIRILMDVFADRESAVMFSDMFDLIEPLGEAMTAAGITYVRLDGQVKARGRASALAKHRAGEARVLLMTSAGEAGVNAQHASLLVSVVQSYSPARESQRVGRIRRLGSPHSSLVHAIVRPDVGHEQRRQQILTEKERLIEAMWQGLK